MPSLTTWVLRCERLRTGTTPASSDRCLRTGDGAPGMRGWWWFDVHLLRASLTSRGRRRGLLKHVSGTLWSAQTQRHCPGHTCSSSAVGMVLPGRPASYTTCLSAVICGRRVGRRRRPTPASTDSTRVARLNELSMPRVWPHVRLCPYSKTVSMLISHDSRPLFQIKGCEMW
jgi:hypothetical protein